MEEWGEEKEERDEVEYVEEVEEVDEVGGGWMGCWRRRKRRG